MVLYICQMWLLKFLFVKIGLILAPILLNVHAIPEVVHERCEQTKNFTAKMDQLWPSDLRKELAVKSSLFHGLLLPWWPAQSKVFHF